MNRPVCCLCNRWISEWMESTGKVMTLGGKKVHVSCAIDTNMSVRELEEKLKE